MSVIEEPKNCDETGITLSATCSTRRETCTHAQQCV